MSLSVKAHYPRGELIIDPGYYTSSIFVEPMRGDIDDLLRSFKILYLETSPPRHVFALFRETWKSKGWDFLHLIALEDTCRDNFLVTLFRLFLERIRQEEESLLRVGALFGLYTAYFGQPTVDVRIQNQIPIPIDIYMKLSMVFTGIQADISFYVTHVLSRFLERRVFLILPPSSTTPYDPCNLPHAVLTKVSPTAKKKGRKSKKEKAQLALAGVKSLEALVETPMDLVDVDEEMSYEDAKEKLKAAVSPEEIRAAETVVLGRMKDMDAGMEPTSLGNDREGLRRVEDAVMTGEGLLDLTRQRGVI